LEWIADRCLVLSEDHRRLGEGAAVEILADRELLLRANLAHEHSHHHGAYVHVHSHERGHHH
jgi:cobalt/nickel transport system ATP-binding protein